MGFPHELFSGVTYPYQSLQSYLRIIRSLELKEVVAGTSEGSDLRQLGQSKLSLPFIQCLNESLKTKVAPTKPSNWPTRPTLFRRVLISLFQKVISCTHYSIHHEIRVIQPSQDVDFTSRRLPRLRCGLLLLDACHRYVYARHHTYHLSILHLKGHDP